MEFLYRQVDNTIYFKRESAASDLPSGKLAGLFSELNGLLLA